MASRRIMTIVELPQRVGSERITKLADDAREAAAQAKAAVEAKAQPFIVTGWKIDEDSWALEPLPDRRFLLSVRITRHD